MRLIDTIRGNGFIVSETQGRNPVQYELEIWQKEVRNDPFPPIPGMEQIRGSVYPAHAFVGEEITLELQDGRKLRFFYTNSGSPEIVGAGVFEQA